jgi:hypothetical protein
MKFKIMTFEKLVELRSPTFIISVLLFTVLIHKGKGTVGS